MEQLPMMQAIGFHRYGAAEVLEPLKLPRPLLAPAQVLIEVAAAGVNPADWVLRSGQLRRFIRLKFPFVPGLEVAGVVAEVGSEVTKFRPGTPVYAMLPNNTGGGYAEYVAVAEDLVAPLPSSLLWSEAAAIPLAALTALQALRDQVQLKPETRLLINGASGGVGSFGVQIAKAMGAHVTATCSARNIGLVKSLGADEVIDYDSAELAAQRGRYDAIFDAVGLWSFNDRRKLLRPKGVFVTVNFLRGNFVLRTLARLTGSQRLKTLFVKPSGDDLLVFNNWIASGQLRPVIDRAYPLSDAIEAHGYSESKRVRGKLVLIVNEKLAANRQASATFSTPGH
jgi:NADPH:quinone reductase-like Zn-dependent oxidoreductase